MSFHLEGIATALPPRAVTQHDAAELASQWCAADAEQAKLLSTLYRRSGVRSRHSVLLENSSEATRPTQRFYATPQGPQDRGPSTRERMQAYERHAGPLAIHAAQQALAAAHRAATEVTHLITVTCSGFSAPGVDIALLNALPLAPHVARTQIGFMGCHGAINGLRVAQAIVEANSSAVVLLVAVELCSVHHQYGWGTDQIVSNSLFADGAAAVVGTSGSFANIAMPPPTAAAWQVTQTESVWLPQTDDLMTWRIADHGFEMTLSPRVPDVIRRELPGWIDAWLARHGLTRAEIPSWAIHPGGPRILSACAESLRLMPRQSADSLRVLEDYGNMSSPTILFILQRLREAQAPLPCVVLGFGPGLVIEGALIQ